MPYSSRFLSRALFLSELLKPHLLRCNFYVEEADKNVRSRYVTFTSYRHGEASLYEEK